MLTEPQMKDLPAEKQAAKAIQHTLSRISNSPTVAYYLGLATQTYSLLTEAHATLNGITMAEAQKNWPPASPSVLNGDQLMPCPFCGSPFVDDCAIFGDPVIQCQECAALGPEGETVMKAREKWNSRVLPRI